ncbi:hypothetical protein KFE25_009516 [Diacronema lutheri]|uniref:Uncharacterized protein n=1 Tax=Diacronema lutheri TaxID=2081491 RepID=A0A8J6CI85_DIALT|nr:hypothetical protein KFE25_009516 [Diacronema lutheri]
MGGARPATSVFAQRAWAMQYSPLYGSCRTVSLLYGLLAVLFGAVACTLAAFHLRVRSMGPIVYHCAATSASARRGACACAMNTTCRVAFVLAEPILPSAMLYYELQPVYQNNRRYVHSWSYAQLIDEQPPSYGAVADACHPRVNEANDPARPPFMPCGLAPASFFTDGYRLLAVAGRTAARRAAGAAGAPAEAEVEVRLSKDGIARGLERYKPERLPAELPITLADLLTWVRASPMPRFRKAYGRLDDGLPAGRYVMEITVRYDVGAFGGSAAFAISSWSALGGRQGALFAIALALSVCSAAAAAHCATCARGSALQRAAAALAHYAADGEPGLGLATRQVGAMYRALVPRPPSWSSPWPGVRL